MRCVRRASLPWLLRLPNAMLVSAETKADPRQPRALLRGQPQAQLGRLARIIHDWTRSWAKSTTKGPWTGPLGGVSGDTRDRGADLEQAVSKDPDLAAGQARAGGTEAELLHQDVGPSGQQDPKLVGQKAVAAGAIELQAVVKLLDRPPPASVRTPGRANTASCYRRPCSALLLCGNH